MKGDGGYILSQVPATDEGKAFLKQLRGYFNYKHFRLRVRGNGPRKHYSYSTPISQATSFRVYVDKKDFGPAMVYLDYHQKVASELEYYKAENDALHKANERLTKVQAMLINEKNLAYCRGWESRIKWESDTVPKWLLWLVRRFT